MMPSLFCSPRVLKSSFEEQCQKALESALVPFPPPRFTIVSLPQRRVALCRRCSFARWLRVPMSEKKRPLSKLNSLTVCPGTNPSFAAEGSPSGTSRGSLPGRPRCSTLVSYTGRFLSADRLWKTLYSHARLYQMAFPVRPPRDSAQQKLRVSFVRRRRLAIDPPDPFGPLPPL